MKKINFKKITIQQIFVFYLLLQPLIDIITTVSVRNFESSISLGVFVRAIFMVFIALYSLIKLNKEKNKKLFLTLITYFSLVAIYCAIYALTCYKNMGSSVLFSQLKGLIKVFYFPITLIGLIIAFKNMDTKKIKQILVSVLAVYSIVIIICKIYGLGYSTYSNRAGTLGLFYAGNEVGAILSLLAPICFLLIITGKPDFKKICICIFTVISMLEIGTKVAFLGLLVLIIISIILSIIENIINKNTRENTKWLNTVSLFLILAFTLLFLGNSSVGNNIGAPKILNLTSSTHEKKETKSNKKKDTKETDVKDLLSSRDVFLSKTIDKYKTEYSILQKIVGVGYYEYQTKDNSIIERKLVEIDYCDLFFCHGIFGILLILGPVIYILIKLFIKFCKNFKLNISSQQILIYAYSIILAFGIALLAGHVFTAPAVSIYLVSTICLLNKDLLIKKDI